MEIAFRPHVMSSQTQGYDIPLGSSVAQVVELLCEADNRVRSLNLCVMVDGHTLPQEQWAVTYADPTKKIEIAAVLQGGGGKRILALVATIALSMAAGPLASAALSGATAGAAFMAAKFGILLVGTLAISAIFAPPRIDVNSGAKQSKAYSFGSQSNSVRPYDSLPRVYGKHRVRPDIAGMPYTTNTGEDTYFTCLYCFGYGPLKLSDFRIGQNPLTNYKDYEIKVHESLTDESLLEIYKQDVWQDALNSEIVQSTPITVTTRPAIDKATVDVLFPQGIGYVNDAGGVDSRVTTMRVEYRAHGSSGAWTPVSGKTSHGSFGTRRSGSFVAPLVEIQDYLEGPSTKSVYRVVAGTTELDVSDWGGSQLTTGATVQIGQYTMTVASSTPTHVVFTSGFEGDLTFPDASVPFTHTTLGTVSDGVWRIEDGKQGSFVAGVDITFPTTGTWSVRFTKIEADPDEESDDYARYLWRRSIIAVKSFKNNLPIDPEVPICVVELRIKATGQLNGSVEEFSAVASAVLPVWNGSAWVPQETRNAAWAYLDVLRGTANSRALSDSRIDMDAIKAWAVLCDAVTAPFTQPMGTCDIVIDKEYTMWEVLQSIAACGRAAPTRKDNKYSILVDSSTRTPVQMFTPRNSSNLQSRRSYIDNPHALRMKFIDPEANYGPAELTVYAPGYDENTATKFETLQTFGMTNVEQVTRYGRYMLAQGRLRQERFSIEVDVENIVCVRGDMVLVAHDVISVGGEPSRIRAISGNRLYFDTPTSIAAYPAGSSGVRIRKNTGLSTSVLALSEVHADGVTLASSVPAGVAVGDLVVYGEVTNVTGSYIVDYIRPKNDLAATIGLEEYAPAVYDAEFTGDIPPYVPQGINSSMLRPPTDLTLTLVEYSEGTSSPLGAVMARWMAPTTARTLPDFYRVSTVAPDGTETTIGDTQGLSTKISGLDLQKYGGRNFVVNVRAFYGASSSSPASETIVLPSRASLPPVNVSAFDVTDLDSGFRRYTFSFAVGYMPEDVVGVEVRYIVGTYPTPDWNAMTVVLTGTGARYFSNSGMEVAVPVAAGDYTFAARAVNKYGVLSDGMYVVGKTLRRSAIATGTAALDSTAPPTPTGVVVTPGITLITVQHDVPTYTMGNGHDRTIVYAHEVTPSSPASPVFADAVEFGQFQGFVNSLSAKPGTTYKIWVKWVTKNGVASAVPAGGTYGYSVTTGQDVDKLLAILNNKLTEDQLYTDLGARIDLIDGSGPGSVNSRIAVESGIRASETGDLYSKTGDLYSKYVVKIDTYGYVTGYGLASVANNGSVVSSFAVRADSFYVANPSGPGISPSMPFIVQTVPTTINGEYVPAGVYMTEAFIRNGTIVSAQIASLHAGKLVAASITADKMAANSITATNGAIENLAVSTLKIQDEAVTIPRSAGGTFSASLWLTTDMTTAFHIIATFTQGTGRDGEPVNLSYDGYVVQTETPIQNTTGAMGYVVTLGAGAHNFSVYASNIVGSMSCSLLVLGTKK